MLDMTSTYFYHLLRLDMSDLLPYDTYDVMHVQAFSG